VTIYVRAEGRYESTVHRRSQTRLAPLRVIGLTALVATGLATVPTQFAGASGPSSSRSAPRIVSFYATPGSLSSYGGSVELSAYVKRATKCTLRAAPSVVGLPASIACSTGQITKTVSLPANGGTSSESYTFTLSVEGANVKVKGTTSASVVSPLTGVHSVVSDPAGSCAVLSTGAVDCWGENYAGAVGNGTPGGPDEGDSYDTPQPVIGGSAAVLAASDGDGRCVVLASGGVDCWGDNSIEEIGNGTIGGNVGTSWDYAQQVSGLTDAVSIASDGGGYCAVLSSGDVDCWGDNTYGELGNGTTGGPDSYYDNSQGGYDTPQAVVGLSDAVSVTSDGGAGDYQSGYCAVLSTGGVDCWGDNSDGELGNGTTGGPDGESGYDIPQSVSGLTDAVSVEPDGGISVSGEGIDYCAVLSSGGVDCWGANSQGQLGNGITGGPDANESYDTPQPVIGITDAVSVTSNISEDRFFSSCAELSSGGVDCWGDNSDGQLGNGTTGGPDGAVGYDTPQAVSGLTDAVSVTDGGGESGFCAVLTSGGVDCWGDNSYGQLGNGTTGGPDGIGGYDTPQAVSGLSDAVSVVSGSFDHGYCAVLSSGGVNCWGVDEDGQLGNGTTGGPDGMDGWFGFDTPQAVSSPSPEV
jgi:alpha-tubulin suppressor-like RCC1 family protein